MATNCLGPHLLTLLLLPCLRAAAQVRTATTAAPTLQHSVCSKVCVLPRGPGCQRVSHCRLRRCRARRRGAW